MNRSFDIDHLARLAKLELSAEERVRLRRDLERILAYVEALKEVPVEGVDPLPYPHEGHFQRMRPDRPRPGLDRNAVIRLAPDELFFLFRTPSPIKGLKKKP